MAQRLELIQDQLALFQRQPFRLRHGKLTVARGATARELPYNAGTSAALTFEAGGLRAGAAFFMRMASRFII